MIFPHCEHWIGEPAYRDSRMAELATMTIEQAGQIDTLRANQLQRPTLVSQLSTVATDACVLSQRNIEWQTP